MKTISNKINHFRAVGIICMLFLLSTSYSFGQWQTLGSNVYFNTGNVGIGTNAPTAKLQVMGNLNVVNPGIYPSGVNIKMDVNDGWAREYSFSYGETGKVFSFGAYANKSQLQYGYIGSNPTGNSAYLIPWMVFMPNGNVGIGGTAATEKLSLFSNTASNVTMQYGNSTTGTGDGNGYIVGIQSDGVGLVWNRENLPIYFGTNKLERMRILANGNIGIGTTTPEHKLDVVGKIRAHGVLVNTTKTADFVFDDDYRLRPLSEVEEFVTTNKHLPEIAPADSMLQNGVDMGDLQIQLLQKIEELTLYMIEQEKRNSELKQQMEQQNNKFEEQNRYNRALENRIRELENQ